MNRPWAERSFAPALGTKKSRVSIGMQTDCLRAFQLCEPALALGKEFMERETPRVSGVRADALECRLGNLHTLKPYRFSLTRLRAGPVNTRRRL